MRILTSIFDDTGVHSFGKSAFGSTRLVRSPGIRIKIPGFEKLHIFLPFDSIRNHYDVIHAYTLFTFSSVLSSVMKWLNRSHKLVIRAEVGPERYQICMPNLTLVRVKRNVIYNKYLNLIKKHVDVFYTYSEHERKALCDLGIREEKTRVIPMGIEFERLSKIDEPLRNDGVVVGYLGRFSYEKGPHRLVEPIKKLMRENANVKVLFAGPKSDPEYANNVIKNLAPHRNFRYSSFLSNIEFLSIADVVLVPSLRETGARIVLESMAAGRLVIASDAYVMNQYICHGASGLLSKNEFDFYKLLKQVIEDKDVIREIGRKAREYAKHHDIVRVVRLVEELYKK